MSQFLATEIWKNTDKVQMKLQFETSAKRMAFGSTISSGKDHTEA
jgi:hypothetical protein